MSLQSFPRPTHSQAVGFQQQEVPHQEDQQQQHPHQSQKEKQNPQLYQQKPQQTPHQHQQEQQQQVHKIKQEQHSPYEHQQEQQNHEQQPNRHECQQKQQDSPYQDQQEQRNTQQHEQEQQQQHSHQCKQKEQNSQHEQEHQTLYENQQEQQQANLHHRQPKQEHSPYQDQQGQEQHPHLDQQQFTSQHEHQHHDHQHKQQHPHQYYDTLQHLHHDHHTPQQLHPHHQHQYPYQQQQQQHMKGGLMCLYPEVRTAIVPNVHSVTKQMHFVSPSVQLAGTFAFSPGNVQLSQNQQCAQRPAIHESPIAQHVYPPPLASHGEVVADKDLFLNTLTKFHAALGTKLSIPRIGGKDLDLHLLYKEVTARGGLEMVIKDRKWKEITLVFNFPPTTTSASFVLRKYYFYLLHQYEQVYFFQLKGPAVTSPVPLPTVSPANHSLSDSECIHSPSEGPEVNLKKQKIDSAQALGVDPASSIGSVVTGCIDGKFEHGYLVNVTVGTRKMRGVLYHVPPSITVPQSATVSPFVNSLGNELKAIVTEHQIERRQKKKLMTRKDPNAPRQNRTGYNFFFAEQRARLKSTQPDKDRAISKMIGDLWNGLSEDEKLPYQERGKKEKERYRREMCEYKERLRLQAQGAAVGTGSSPSGLQMGTKSDHESDIDLNKVEVQQEAIPYQEQLVQPLSGSSTVTDTSNHQVLVLGNSGANVTENLSPKDGYPATVDEEGAGKKARLSCMY